MLNNMAGLNLFDCSGSTRPAKPLYIAAVSE